MEPLGAYINNAAFKESKGYTIQNVEGVKIAFVAFTKGMNGLGLPEGSENSVNLLYKDYASTYQTIDTEGITKVLQAVEAQQPDVTIALLHWGSEFNSIVSTRQEKIATLRDSLGKALAQKDGVEVQYVEKIIRDTIFVYKTAKDSSAATKTEMVKPARGKLGVFVDGHASYGKDGFGYEATGGVKYHILEPLYLKAGVQYDGGIRGILGGGIEFRF